MKRLTHAALIVLLPLASACSVVKHGYVAGGRSAVSYRERGLSPADDFRFGFTLAALPTWAFGWSFNQVRNPDSAGYREPRCLADVALGFQRADFCQPTIVARSAAFEVQKRWAPTEKLHPIASAMVGDVITGNVYRIGTASYSNGSAPDSGWKAPFVTLAGGGEYSLNRWLHVRATAGYRQVFRTETRNGSNAPSGFTATSLVVIGTSYRDP